MPATEMGANRPPFPLKKEEPNKATTSRTILAIKATAASCVATSAPAVALFRSAIMTDESE